MPSFLFCFGTRAVVAGLVSPAHPAPPGPGTKPLPAPGRPPGSAGQGGAWAGEGRSVPGNRDGARPRPGDPRSAPVCAHPGAGGRSPQASPVSRRSSLRPPSPVPGAGGAAAARAGVPVPGAPPLPLRSVISRPVGSAGLCGSGDPVRPPSAPPGPGPPPRGGLAPPFRPQAGVAGGGDPVCKSPGRAGPPPRGYQLGAGRRAQPLPPGSRPSAPAPRPSAWPVCPQPARRLPVRTRAIGDRRRRGRGAPAARVPVSPRGVLGTASSVGTEPAPPLRPPRARQVASGAVRRASLSPGRRWSVRAGRAELTLSAGRCGSQRKAARGVSATSRAAPSLPEALGGAGGEAAAREDGVGVCTFE